MHYQTLQKVLICNNSFSEKNLHFFLLKTLKTSKRRNSVHFKTCTHFNNLSSSVNRFILGVFCVIFPFWCIVGDCLSFFPSAIPVTSIFNQSLNTASILSSVSFCVRLFLRTASEYNKHLWLIMRCFTLKLNKNNNNNNKTVNIVFKNIF